jgi:alpha-beta hydrolase superfamily lysophospholipase
MTARSTTARKGALVAGAAGAIMAGVSAAGSVGAATYFARRVVTPDPRRPDDTEILAVGEDRVTLGLTAETAVRGRYGLWLDGGEGHARVGDVLDVDHERGRVTRRLEGVDSGRLTVGFARWNQYYYAGSPQDAFGLETHDVRVRSELGDLPAWLVPAEASAAGAGDRWAILVHGRGARREECLRAVPVTHELGYTTLIPMYRNDIGAPPSPDGRYNLGLSEWRDVESAMVHAVEAGAREIVLMGWSMGGAIVLQTLDRSWLSGRVSRVVLDAPVIDWSDVRRNHAASNRVPAPVGAMSRALMGRRAARRLVGVHEPIDVALTDWVRRCDELAHPMLLIHSEDDEFVPVGPSAALAAARPDLVTWEPWREARHTKEWNVDPARWDAAVRAFLTRG